MINLTDMQTISPIFLTVFLIAYLILAELGNEKIRKALLPLLFVLIAIFLIIAVVSIYSVYRKLG